jgi:two-component system, NarL family, invasion response regulator UvrY
MSIQDSIVRILVADDHEMMRRGITQTLLEEYPLAYIEHAENGEVLVEKTKGAEWHIVITDISMPVMNGIEALRQIKINFPDIPVLVLSLHNEEQYFMSALQAGASGFVSKAMAQCELIIAVRKILAGKKYIPSSLILKINNKPDYFL